MDILFAIGGFGVRTCLKRWRRREIIFQRIADRRGRGTRVKEIGFIGLPEYAGAEQALNELVASGAT
jgi:hypothetical protein